MKHKKYLWKDILYATILLGTTCIVLLLFIISKIPTLFTAQFYKSVWIWFKHTGLILLIFMNPGSIHEYMNTITRMTEPNAC
jgi:hypothetical protein